eukprot:403332913
MKSAVNSQNYLTRLTNNMKQTSSTNTRQTVVHSSNTSIFTAARNSDCISQKINDNDQQNDKIFQDQGITDGQGQINDVFNELYHTTDNRNTKTTKPQPIRGSVKIPNDKTKRTTLYTSPLTTKQQTQQHLRTAQISKKNSTDLNDPPQIEDNNNQYSQQGSPTMSTDQKLDAKRDSKQSNSYSTTLSKIQQSTRMTQNVRQNQQINPKMHQVIDTFMKQSDNSYLQNANINQQNQAKNQTPLGSAGINKQKAVSITVSKTTTEKNSRNNTTNVSRVTSPMNTEKVKITQNKYQSGSALNTNSNIVIQQDNLETQCQQETKPPLLQQTILTKNDNIQTRKNSEISQQNTTQQKLSTPKNNNKTLQTIGARKIQQRNAQPIVQIQSIQNQLTIDSNRSNVKQEVQVEQSQQNKTDDQHKKSLEDHEKQYKQLRNEFSQYLLLKGDLPLLEKSHKSYKSCQASYDDYKKLLAHCMLVDTQQSDPMIDLTIGQIWLQQLQASSSTNIENVLNLFCGICNIQSKEILVQKLEAKQFTLKSDCFMAAKKDGIMKFQNIEQIQECHQKFQQFQLNRPRLQEITQQKMLLHQDSIPSNLSSIHKNSQLMSPMSFQNKSPDSLFNQHLMYQDRPVSSQVIKGQGGMFINDSQSEISMVSRNDNINHKMSQESQQNSKNKNSYKPVTMISKTDRQNTQAGFQLQNQQNQLNIQMSPPYTKQPLVSQKVDLTKNSQINDLNFNTQTLTSNLTSTQTKSNETQNFMKNINQGDDGNFTDQIMLNQSLKQSHLSFGMKQDPNQTQVIDDVSISFQQQNVDNKNTGISIVINQSKKIPQTTLLGKMGASLTLQVQKKLQNTSFRDEIDAFKDQATPKNGQIPDLKSQSTDKNKLGLRGLIQRVDLSMQAVGEVQKRINQSARRTETMMSSGAKKNENKNPLSSAPKMFGKRQQAIKRSITSDGDELSEDEKFNKQQSNPNEGSVMRSQNHIELQDPSNFLNQISMIQTPAIDITSRLDQTDDISFQNKESMGSKLTDFMKNSMQLDSEELMAKNRPLFFMDIKINPGQPPKKIIFYDRDSPSYIAKKFSIANKLDEKIQQNLEKKLRKKMQEAMKIKIESMSPDRYKQDDIYREEGRLYVDDMKVVKQGRGFKVKGNVDQRPLPERNESDDEW